jgi:lysozyme
MRMTDEGLALIRESEGFRAKAYRDPVGVWTIGFGHTSAAGPPQVFEGLTITPEQGRKILARDVEMFALGVAKALRAPVTDNEFSALVSFAYNVGLGAFQRSSVLRAVNAGDREAVPRRLQLWVKAGGRVFPGLVKRRAAEAALFMKGREALPPRKASNLWIALASLIAAAVFWIIRKRSK